MRVFHSRRQIYDSWDFLNSNHLSSVSLQFGLVLVRFLFRHGPDSASSPLSVRCPVPVRSGLGLGSGSGSGPGCDRVQFRFCLGLVLPGFRSWFGCGLVQFRFGRVLVRSSSSRSPTSCFGLCGSGCSHSDCIWSGTFCNHI